MKDSVATKLTSRKISGRDSAKRQDRVKNNRRSKRRRKNNRFSKYNRLSKADQAILRSLKLLGNWKTTLFDRRTYLNDRVALAALKLLRDKFPGNGGFQSVLLSQQPRQRDRN